MAPGAAGGAGRGLGRADVFFWRFNSRRRASGVVSVPCSPGTPLLEILAAAAKASGTALLRRAGSIGAYEVQTDEGIWSVTDNTAEEPDPDPKREPRPERGVQRSLISYSAKTGAVVRPQAIFRTWQELEALEQAEPRGDFRDRCARTTKISMNNNAKEKHAHG